MAVMTDSMANDRQSGPIGQGDCNRRYKLPQMDRNSDESETSEDDEKGKGM